MHHDAFVLSLPGFVWTKLPEPPAGPRCEQSCVVVGKRQILSIGGADRQTQGAGMTQKDEAPNGLLLFDMSTLKWKDSYDANAAGYQRADVIKAWYSKGSMDNVEWADADLQKVFATESKCKSVHAESASSGSLFLTANTQRRLGQPDLETPTATRAAGPQRPRNPVPGRMQAPLQAVWWEGLLPLPPLRHWCGSSDTRRTATLGRLPRYIAPGMLAICKTMVTVCKAMLPLRKDMLSLSKDMRPLRRGTAIRTTSSSSTRVILKFTKLAVMIIARRWTELPELLPSSSMAGICLERGETKEYIITLGFRKYR